MSLTYNDEVVCPCGEAFEVELYESISVKENPELKDAVLAGELNVVRCPSCKHMIYAERFLLYHDKDQELLAFVYPKDTEDQEQSLNLEMSKRFKTLQESLPAEDKFKYVPFLLFGLDALCDLIVAEESLRDESDVVFALAENLDLTTKKISIDLARRCKLPLVLPFGIKTLVARVQVTELFENLFKNADSAGVAGVTGAAEAAGLTDLRVSLIKGLKAILNVNDQLPNYQKLLNRLEAGSSPEL